MSRSPSNDNLSRARLLATRGHLLPRLSMQIHRRNRLVQHALKSFWTLDTRPTPLRRGRSTLHFTSCFISASMFSWAALTSQWHISLLGRRSRRHTDKHGRRNTGGSGTFDLECPVALGFFQAIARMIPLGCSHDSASHSASWIGGSIDDCGYLWFQGAD